MPNVLHFRPTITRLDTKYRTGRLCHRRRICESLQRIIEQNGLQQYDKLVMQEMETQGKRFGTEHNPLRTSENSEYGAKYSFPVEREEFLFVTSPFGMR